MHSICVVSLFLGVVIDGFRQAKEDSIKPPVLDPEDFAQCHLSESDCSIKDMNRATLVYTDSDTSRCLNGDPWAFLVHPGATDKLLYYFTGGGACWESDRALPFGIRPCHQNFIDGFSETGYGNGVMEFSNSRNVFGDYTVVSPPYCSGGAHIANNTAKKQYDYNNNNFAINWARKNTDRRLKSFVMAGSSAGALGAMVWSDFLLGTFQYEKAAVLFDSYVGVFPKVLIGRVVRDWGACNLPMMKNFRATCEAGKASVEDVVDYAIANNPGVAFAHIQPKTDMVQRAFFSALEASFKGSGNLIIGKSEFYKAANVIMERYNKHANYVAYLSNGNFHTCMHLDTFYKVTVSGKTGHYAMGRPMVAEWVRRIVNGEEVSSECRGEIKEPARLGSIFCDNRVFPKTLSFKP